MVPDMVALEPGYIDLGHECIAASIGYAFESPKMRSCATKSLYAHGAVLERPPLPKRW